MSGTCGNSRTVAHGGAEHVDSHHHPRVGAHRRQDRFESVGTSTTMSVAYGREMLKTSPLEPTIVIAE